MKRVAEENGKEASQLELDITKYDVVNHEVYPKIEEVDAVLLTGSSKLCCIMGEERVED